MRAKQGLNFNFRRNALGIHVFVRFGPGISPAGIVGAKSAYAKQSMNSQKSYTAREWRAESELRRKPGRTDWLGQVQLKHTMKQI